VDLDCDGDDEEAITVVTVRGWVMVEINAVKVNHSVCCWEQKAKGSQAVAVVAETFSVQRMCVWMGSGLARLYGVGEVEPEGVRGDIDSLGKGGGRGTLVGATATEPKEKRPQRICVAEVLLKMNCEHNTTSERG
jgi:hypothetical protein